MLQHRGRGGRHQDDVAKATFTFGQWWWRARQETPPHKMTPVKTQMVLKRPNFVSAMIAPRKGVAYMKNVLNCEKVMH